MVFGTFDYFIVRLADNMISLAEAPQPIVFDRKFGPYGEGKTDDKPSLHKFNGMYYLSWSSFYAMSLNPYGPYKFKGTVIDAKYIDKNFQVDTTKTKMQWHDRHGNFFTWHNQWFYTYNDKSHPWSNNRFRDANISYVHYRDNGEMAPIHIDRIGVGQYYVNKNPIEAENYFAAEGVKIKESPSNGFEVRCKNGSLINYPNVMNLPKNATVSFLVSLANSKGATIEIYEDNLKGKLLGKCKIPNTKAWNKYQTISCKIKNDAGKMNLLLLVKGNNEELIRIDNFKINN